MSKELKEWVSELEIKWTSELVSERVSGWVDKSEECVVNVWVIETVIEWVGE